MDFSDDGRLLALGALGLLAAGAAARGSRTIQTLAVGDRITSRSGVSHLVEAIEHDLVRLRPVNEEDGPASLWTPRTLIASGEIQTELTYLLLACDDCGRQFDPGEAMVTAALRRAAEAEGWNGNFCPNCQEGP